jgi:hypothetical protein
MNDAELIAKCRSIQERAERLGFPNTSAAMGNIIKERFDLNRQQTEKVTRVAKFDASSVSYSKSA